MSQGTNLRVGFSPWVSTPLFFRRVWPLILLWQLSILVKSKLAWAAHWKRECCFWCCPTEAVLRNRPTFCPACVQVPLSPGAVIRQLTNSTDWRILEADSIPQEWRMFPSHSSAPCWQVKKKPPPFGISVYCKDMKHVMSSQSNEKDFTVSTYIRFAERNET